MATESLGKVSLTLGGNYSPTASYARLTVVRGANGNSYVSKTSVAGVEPGTDPGWEDYWQILALDGSQGGDSVSWEQTVTTGTKIAAITINGTPTDVYAPNGGGGVQIDDNAGSGATTVAWSANKIVTELALKQTAPTAAPSGTSTQPVLALVNGTPTWVDKVSFTRNISSGIQIAAIRIDGAAQATQIYAPVCTVITDAASTVTLQPCPVTYSFGEKAELNITVTATSQYHFMFTCPSGAATVLTLTGITGKTGDTTLAAGKTYEVDVWAGIAYFKAIEVTAVT